MTIRILNNGIIRVEDLTLKCVALYLHDGSHAGGFHTPTMRRAAMDAWNGLRS